MKQFVLALIIALLAGCAVQSEPRADEAIENYVALSGLEEMDSIKTREQFRISEISELSERYIFLRTRKDIYLVKFKRRCYELDDVEVTPDIRLDGGTLRPHFDTIRGCRIEKIYAIDEAEAQELEMLAMAPGQGRG
jgi:hypothetical protein